jgi:hypothetical protein
MIVTMVVVAIVGVMFLSYMGTSLYSSGDPLNIARDEAIVETWMERIMSDYVKEMNSAAYAAALTTIKNRNYTAAPYNMPADVTLSRTYVTYDSGGNEIESGSSGSNLKLTVTVRSYTMTTILTSQRTTPGDPYVSY